MEETAEVALSDGSHVRKLCSTPEVILKPAWSPDGRRIRFTAALEQRHSQALWETPVELGRAHPLFASDTGLSNDCCGSPRRSRRRTTGGWRRDGRPASGCRKRFMATRARAGEGK